MTTLELQKKLLGYYTEHYKVAEGMDVAPIIKKYLSDNDLDKGVCHAAKQVFGEVIYLDKWVVDYCVAGVTWHTYPLYCFSKHDILAALQTRITILKKLIA